MDIQIKAVDDVVVVTLTGVMDGRTAPALEKQLLPLAESTPRLLLNMGGITFLSSAGLRILLILYRQINNQGGCIALANLRETIEDTMSVTGFFHFFTAYPTEKEGITALRGCVTKPENNAAN